MIKTILSPIFLIFLTLPSYAQFDTGRWAVTQVNAPAYTDASGVVQSGTLPYAYGFKAKNRRGNRVSFMRDAQELWVNTNALIKIDFTAQNFSSQPADFLPSEIQGSNFTFLYKNAVYRLNAETLDTQNLVKVSDTPKSSAAYFSKDGEITLLAGASEKGLNLAFFLPRQKKFIPLSILTGEASLITAEFSPNHSQVALHIALGERQHLLLYRTDTGELTASVPEVQAFRWSGGGVVVAKKNSVVLLNSNGQETTLYLAPKNKKEIQTIIAMPADEFLIDIDGSVYRLDGDGIVKTAYPSIERSRSGSLQRSEKNNVVNFTYKGKPLRSLSGKTPLWDFISFAGDESLVYSQKSTTGAITTLYYYDAAQNQSLPYRWVEEPIQVLDNGLAYEAVEESGETWLFFEYPGGKAVMLRLNELLR